MSATSVEIKTSAPVTSRSEIIFHENGHRPLTPLPGGLKDFSARDMDHLGIDETLDSLSGIEPVPLVDTNLGVPLTTDQEIFLESLYRQYDIEDQRSHGLSKFEHGKNNHARMDTKTREEMRKLAEQDVPNLPVELLLEHASTPDTNFPHEFTDL